MTAKGFRSYVAAFYGKLRGGESRWAPVVLCLIPICVVFQTLNSNFLSPRNLSNIGVDMAGPGLIATGLIFVLLVGEIDLSIGAVSGLAAAVFALLAVNHGLPEWLAVITAVLTGAATGAVHGFFFARIGVSSFAVTLAGLLGWNGLMVYLLDGTGSITLDAGGLVGRLTRTYVDGAAAYGLAGLGVAVYFLASWKYEQHYKASGMLSRSLSGIGIRAGVLAVVAFGAVIVLNRFQGLPLALLIFLAVVAGLDFVLYRATYGRKVLALGGGAEAAGRFGLNVAAVRISVFILSGAMAAIGGLFIASRITSVSQASGGGSLVVDVIAAAVIGGTSLFGGYGTPWSGVLGMLVIQSIASGVALLGIQASVQLMITGGVLLAAVVMDSLFRRYRQLHGRALWSGRSPLSSPGRSGARDLTSIVREVRQLVTDPL
ncbi:sugar ABC transporter permease [Streptomyces sp.]|uniref:sugar ABC transporter permease n=1 Tax=Streptomyces sp. TaxID=1931 RepID=UPI0039C98E82